MHTWVYTCTHIAHLLAYTHAYIHAQVYMHTHAGYPVAYWFEELLRY